MSYKSREVQFLNRLLEEEHPGKISNPMLSAIFSQFRTLLVLLDSKEPYRTKVRNILNRIKEEWNDQP